MTGGPTMLIAIGGNSLIKPGQAGTIAEQFDNARETAVHVAEIAARGWRIALTHGNGPQVGFILRRSEVARDVAPRLTLDMCGADAQGGIGYILQQTIGTAFTRRSLDRSVVALVTQVEVDPADPAFERPTKPIGQFYAEQEARKLQREAGLNMVHDPAKGWRRVVPSPRPVDIVESDAISALVADGVVTICAGGGGIPVIRGDDGDLRGAEAVVDKDSVSTLLAARIGARVLMISTQVPKVALHFGTPEQRPLTELTAEEAEEYLGQGHFPPGSMGPKIEAALRFLRQGGERVVISDPPNLEAALDGRAGTTVVGS